MVKCVSVPFPGDVSSPPYPPRFPGQRPLSELPPAFAGGRRQMKLLQDVLSPPVQDEARVSRAPVLIWFLQSTLASPEQV